MSPKDGCSDLKNKFRIVSRKVKKFVLKKKKQSWTKEIIEKSAQAFVNECKYIFETLVVER